jgi:hypothetical protein
MVLFRRRDVELEREVAEGWRKQQTVELNNL